MAVQSSLTNQLGFASDQFDFAFAQNQRLGDQLYAGLGLLDGLEASLEITLPEFGEPFLDLISNIRESVGGHAHLLEFVSLSSKIPDVIERLSKLPSENITRSAKRD